MNKTLQSVRAAFARLTVGAQISLAFGAVLLLAASLGVVSLWSLTRLDDSADELNVKWLARRGPAGARARRRRRGARVRDQAQPRQRPQLPERVRREVQQCRQGSPTRRGSRTRRCPRPMTTRRWRPMLAKAWQAYRKASEQVLGLGRAKKQQDAADISDGAASMAIDETVGALDRLVEYNFKHAEIAARRAPTRCTRARATRCWPCSLPSLLVRTGAVGVVHAPTARPARRPARRCGGDGARGGCRRPGTPAWRCAPTTATA